MLRRFLARLTRSSAQAEIVTLLERVLAEQKRQAEWRSVFQRQLSALVRLHAFAGSDIPQPYALRARGFRLRSQNDEDGITLALLNAAGITGRRFVEIGCGSSGGNSAILAFECGWSGLMAEVSEKKAATLRRELAFNPGVVVLHKRVTPDNLNKVLRHHGCAGDIEFMSIDVDSVDYWLLDALAVASPRVLVMEYNAHFGAERSVTLPATGLPDVLPYGYFGASLAALTKKAREKGYRLVFCEDRGVNAFFLRHDVAPEFQELPVAVAYRSSVSETKSVSQADVLADIASKGLPLVEV